MVLRFLGPGGATPEPSLANDASGIASIAPPQVEALVGLVLDFLQVPKSSTFQEGLGAFAQSNGLPIASLKGPVRALIIFARGALHNSLTPAHVVEDLTQLGLPQEVAEAVGRVWKVKYVGLCSSVISTIVTAHQLVDMEWKFGVTAASDEQRQMGATFLQVKLVIEKGGGRREDVFMELSLPQFYHFLANMEKAKSYMDFLTG